MRTTFWSGLAVAFGCIHIACGTPAATESGASASERPVTFETQASAATQEELGVAGWQALHKADGEMSVFGLDASGALRVVLSSNANELRLLIPAGSFGVLFDGNGVRANTVAGNSAARRALDRIREDISAALAAGEPSALGTSTIRGGALQPTAKYERCQKGTLVEACPQLLVGDCNADKLHECALYSGARAASSDAITDECSESPTIASTPECTEAFEGFQAATSDFKKAGCYACGDQWRQDSDPSRPGDTFLNCQALGSTPSEEPICDYPIYK